MYHVVLCSAVNSTTSLLPIGTTKEKNAECPKHEGEKKNESESDVDRQYAEVWYRDT